MQRTTFVRNTLATIAAYSSLPSSSKLSMEECDNKSIGGKSAVSNHSQKDLNSVLKEIYASIKSRSLSQPRSLESQQQPIRSTTLNSYGSTLRSPNPSSFHISRSRSAGGIKRISSFSVSSPASPNTVDTVVSSPGSSKKRSIVSMSAASQYSEASFTTFGESIPPSPTLRAVINASMRIEDMEDPAGVFNKSGVLSRKHLYEKTDKKAQNRAWKECYALLDRGELKMYKLEKGGTDGSELQDINLQLGAMSLRHSLAVLLPPPGYSTSRPHVLALQLPNGGVYLFQASSGEMAKDWVGACNYWAARESKEPMAGGIDNREYGWGRPTVNEDDSAEEVKREIIVAEWNPPPVSMLRSSYDDNNQLRALLSHIAKLENDLLDHKELRENLNRWPAKSPNYIRAFGNWERKSQWLLRELIKYQTYADCLKQVIISRHSPGEEGILPPSMDNSGGS